VKLSGSQLGSTRSSKKASMNTEDQLRQSAIWLRKAVTQIKELNIPSNPKNYTIWYDYFSEEKPELSVELNRLLDENTPFTAGLTNSIFDRFYSENSELKLEQIRNAIKSLIEILSAQINSIDENLNDYDKVLVKCETQLTKEPDIDTLNQLVSNLLHETRNNLSKNKKALKQISELNQEINEMRESLIKLSEEALEDALTGISNRRAFNLELDKIISNTNTNKAKNCLLLVDIDLFKTVNDDYGHQIGDKILCFVAKMIKKCIKGGDFVSRFGGDEFAIIFPNTDYQGGMAIAETIIETVANRKLVLNKQGCNLGYVTLSGGLSFAQVGDTPDSLIQRADQGLYKAKSKGRNKVIGQSRI